MAAHGELMSLYVFVLAHLHLAALKKFRGRLHLPVLGYFGYSIE